MHNPYQQTRFTTSANTLKQLPADSGREVAFCGRSNVGKSSVINVLTMQNRLARSSKQPGRTQLLNFFTVQDGVRLVDLPGYGYAKVPQAMQRHWHTTINGYLHSRESLFGLVLIVDIRRRLNAQDEELIHWCQAGGLPVHLLLNKADKLAFGQAKASLMSVQKELSGDLQDAERCSIQLFSALKKSGVDELRAQLNSWLFAESGKKNLAPEQ